MILQQKSCSFNSNVEISNDGGELSTDGGLILTKEYMHKSGLENKIMSLKLSDHRKFYYHSKNQLLLQLIFQNFAGYENDDDADTIKNNKLFRTILNKDTLASQPTLSRFINSITEYDIGNLEKFMVDLSERYYHLRKPKEIVIDVDSTHFDTFGNQEGNSYNYHYRSRGYHPIMAYDSDTGFLFKAKLRFGNVYTSNGIVDFMKPLFEWLKKIGIKQVTVRGDSGFAVPEFYELCEEYSHDYVIRLKSNSRLKRMANKLEKSVTADQIGDEIIYGKALYKADSWNHEREVFIELTKDPESGKYNPIFIISTLKDDETKKILRKYRDRGNMENFIKESKSGFFMDRTNSSKFLANTFRMMVGAISYNIFILMKEQTFSSKIKHWTIQTVREKLIKVGAKIVYHANKIRIKLDSFHVYQEYFWAILNAISKIVV